MNTSIRLHPFSPPTTSWSLVKTNKNTKKHLLTAILRSHHTRVHERNHVVSCWNHYGACAACTYSQWELHITGNLDYKMPFYYLGRVQIDSLPILCIIVCNTTNCWSDLKVAWLLCLVLATGLYVRRLHVGPYLWCNTCCVPAYLLYASYYIKTSKLWIKNIKPLKYVGICLFLYFVLFVSPVCHVSPYPWSQCHVHVSLSESHCVCVLLPVLFCPLCVMFSFAPPVSLAVIQFSCVPICIVCISLCSSLCSPSWCVPPLLECSFVFLIDYCTVDSDWPL